LASKVDIWNLALSNIGHRANVADPDEVTAEANHCRRFYPIALGVALERFAWSFATRRVALAEVTNPVDHWGYAYALPNLCVKARAVLLPESTDDSKEQAFAIESDDNGDAILYCNVEDAVLKYTTLVEDTVKFTYLFVLTLSYDLAAMLVGPIPKDPKIKKGMLDAAVYYVGLAEAADANAALGKAYGDFIPSHLAAR
jgi:hypothetical protein